MENVLEPLKMELLRQLCKKLIRKNYSIQNLVGCIYDLYDDEIISELQAGELFTIVDPTGKYNEANDYREQLTWNPLFECIK